MLLQRAHYANAALSVTGISLSILLETKYAHIDG